MRLSLPALFSVSFLLLAACDKPCPKGQQRYGVKCVMRLVPDSGTDANGGLDAGPSNTQDDGGLSSCIPPKCHPCEFEPCQNAGVCSETDTGFECACKVGFSGKVCAIDACVIDPCMHGECTRKSSGRECKCEPGFVGDACETNTNATLVSLTVSAGTLYPAFSPNVHAYSVDLGLAIPEVRITPRAAAPNGVTLTIDEVVLASGESSPLWAMPLNSARDIRIGVVAEDGTELTYVVTVRRSLAQRAYVKSDPSAEEDYFGGDVSEVGLSHFGGVVAIEGDMMAVGRPKNAGTVNLFIRESGAWAPNLKVISASEHEKEGALFGSTVSLDEEWLLVGAPGESAGTGAAYAFRRSTLSDDLRAHRLVPRSPVAGQRFGSSVAVREGKIVVGAMNEEVLRAGIAQSAAGAAYVFEFDGLTWGEGERIVSPNPHREDRFGADIAVDEGRVIVGSFGDHIGELQVDGAPGAVYIYEQVATGWTLSGTLRVPNSVGLGASVAATSGRIAASSIRFCLSACTGQPQVYLFSKEGADWSVWKTFGLPKPEDTATLFDARQFGFTGIAFTGSTLVVSAFDELFLGKGINPARDPAVGGAGGTGAVYAFVEHSDGWKLDAYIKASNAEGNDYFGMSLAASNDTIVVAAPGEASNADGISVNNVAAQGDNTAPLSGAVYVFSTNCDQVPAGVNVPGC